MMKQNAFIQICAFGTGGKIMLIDIHAHAYRLKRADGKGMCTLEELIASQDRMGIDMDHGAITEELISRAHAAGLVFNAWTVDSPERAQQLISWGIDYLTTDIPE